jgi:hypothetical protein
MYHYADILASLCEQMGRGPCLQRASSLSQSLEMGRKSLFSAIIFPNLALIYYISSGNSF